jgi:hypothetical protein
VKWEKNKIYETKPVNSDIEASIIFIYIETETLSYYAQQIKRIWNVFHDNRRSKRKK